MDPVLPLPGTPKAVLPNGAPPPPAAEPSKPAAADPMAAVLAKERDLVRKQQEWGKERDTIRAELEKEKGWRKDLVKNPDLLKEVLGDDWYEKLTEYRLNGGKPTAELIGQSVEAKLQEFEKRQEEKAAAERTRIADEQAATLENFRNETTEWVKAQPDYELINMHGAQSRVVQVIEHTFKQTQKIMSAKEASDFVENELYEAIQKSLSTKRFKTPPPGTATPEKPKESAQPRTLTNAHGPVGTPAPTEPLDMSDDARLARAIAKGQAIQRSRQGQ